MVTNRHHQTLGANPAKGSALIAILLLLTTIGLLGVLSIKLARTQILISSNLASSNVAFTDNENNLKLAVRYIQESLQQPTTFNWSNRSGLYNSARSRPLTYSMIISDQFWTNKNTVKSSSDSRYIIEFMGKVYFTTKQNTPTSTKQQAINIFRITSRTYKQRGMIKISQILYSQRSLAKSGNRNKSTIPLKNINPPLGILSWTDL